MRRRSRRWTGLALGALLAATPAGARPVAEQITLANAAERLFGGTDADGGIGDWYVSNGVIEAIIDDVGPQEDLPPGVVPPPRQSEAAITGGVLLDLARVGADNDQLNQLFTVGGLSASNFIAYDSIRASASDSEATITVTGRVLGFDPLLPSELPVVTEYVASGSEPYLTIRTTVRNDGATVAPFLGGFLDVMPWTTRAIVPFSPLPGRGFDHQALNLANPLAALEQPVYTVGPGNASPADGMMDPETGKGSGEVSYGLLGVRAMADQDGDGPEPPIERDVNQLFGISSVEATALGNVPVVGGLIPGGVLRYERRVYVGTRNDVASALDEMLPVLGARMGFATGTLSGNADARDQADVAVNAIAIRTGGPTIANLPNGSPVTEFRSDATGAFSGVRVPEGTYEISFRAPERDPVVVSGVEVQGGADTVVAIPPLGGLGTLRLRAQVQGEPRAPVKVAILGRDGTPDPQLGRDFEARVLRAGQPPEDLAPESFGSALAQGRFVYVTDGAGSVGLRPGDYEVIASHGPEYGIDRQLVSVVEGEARELHLRLPRLLRTPDALSADFHIHSARSLDSSAGPVGRVISFAAEGVDVMVGTDHDFVIDYGPVIESLGLGHLVAALVGEEVTTSVPNPPVFPNAIGHINAWPLNLDPHARKDGAVEDEYVAPNFLYSRLRRAGAEVIQYNHPRAGTRGLTTIGIFNNIGCNRCENDVDQTCEVDADCPADPAPRSCTCVGYRPERPLDAVPNDVLLDDDVTGSSGVHNPDGLRNIDFDVMEVGNGLNAGYLETRRDWFSLLDQAYGTTERGPIPFIPGSGVSDSHRNTLESAGYFRSYVLGAGDSPQKLDRETFDASVLAGRMVVTTGPYIELSVRDAGRSKRRRPGGPGATMGPAGPDVLVQVRVRAANWVPVPQVRIIANGAAVRVFDATTDPAVAPAPDPPWSRSRRSVVRFEAEIPLHLERDSWILAEAGVPLDPFPDPDPFVDRFTPDWRPVAFTNPVFIDLAGDGFDPPGVQPVGGRGGAAARRAAAASHGHDELPIRRLRIPESAARAALARQGRR